MEIFILALIDKAGLTSLYAFQQQAGLQPGGIRSTLERLEQRSLIERAESSARQRRDYSLTLEGSVSSMLPGSRVSATSSILKLLFGPHA